MLEMPSLISPITNLVIGLTIYSSIIGSATDTKDQICSSHKPAYHNHSSQCLPWRSSDPVSCPCKCRKNQQIDEIKCLSNAGVLLEFGYCLTYEDNLEMFQFGICPYFQPRMGHNITKQGYVQLPDGMSELNYYMCGLMNRKGPLCSECIDGFGPALTSVGHICSNCTDAWYGVPLYLIVELVPITVLYFVILIFQINVTSAPMTCFIMYSQIILFEVRYERRPPIGRLIYQLRGPMSSTLNVVYGLVNLELIRPIIPPFCVSSRLQFVHISVLEYLPAFYPLFLILLTWVCIELHGRNFRVLVHAWKPFHKCFFYLRKGWSTKSDLIGVFATFFLFSYSKILFQSFFLIGCETTYIFNEGNFSSVSTTRYDTSESCQSGPHIAIAFFGTLVLCVFNIIPTMLLVLYPIKMFRICLSKCKLDGIAITAFVEKYHSCYRDGLDGGRDMRSFAGLYFLLRAFICFYPLFSVLSPFVWFSYSLLFLLATVLIAYVKPYKKMYMNIIDTILLATITVLTQLSTSDYFESQATEVFALSLMPAIMLMLFCMIKLAVNKTLERMNTNGHDLKLKLIAMLSHRCSKFKEKVLESTIEVKDSRSDSCKGLEMSTENEEIASSSVTVVSWEASY